MRILKDLSELLDAGVITDEVAQKIRSHYEKNQSSSAHRLFVVFGILGAILVGLGIVLIVAHNWDEFPRTVRTFFALLPMVSGQLLCLFAVLKRNGNVAWVEGSASFLFFAVAAAIALVSQIYHIPGNLSSYLLTWTLLCLPLVYIMRSSMTSLLSIVTMTYYACETGYWSYPSTIPFAYWILLLALFPHYYRLYRNKPFSNFTVLHHWLVPLSMVISLGTFAAAEEELMFVAYMSLLGCLYLVGNTLFFERQRPMNNGYRAIGSLGTVALLLALSFDWFWDDLRRNRTTIGEALLSFEFLAAIMLTVLAVVLLILHVRRKSVAGMKSMSAVFALFVVIYLIGMFLPVAPALVNLCVLGIGILVIREGARETHFGLLNYGLLIVAVLVACRFFDTHLSFIVRGVMFVTVGAGFFLLNYWTLKRKGSNG